ncbi:hypothetical protein B0T21DRAFT_357866 [Apiosordaria backusii]|uniref:Uncharacterized protein n=1 Tax=Apiosordaria backusii TaxID=314023 RepID=A0AA40ES35_9PEZI|nr:hypothetical protein B0T21DRAFT_357866 [Apiosordaria backusii]
MTTTPFSLPPSPVWFITGCSSGIGRSLAHLISTVHPTHRLVATARNLSSLSYLPQSNNTLPLPLDVSSPTSITTAITTTLSHFGNIDILVNNAGYMLLGDTESSLTPAGTALAHEQLETNFWGPASLTLHALKQMRKKTGNGGVILNVASMGGRLTVPGAAYYHASKFALEGFTDALAKEIRPEWNVKLGIIEPGVVKTAFVTGVRRLEDCEGYEGGDTPRKVMEGFMEDEEKQQLWSEPGKLAEEIVRVVLEVEERGLAMRTVLGPDAWGLLRTELGRQMEELEQGKERAVRVGKEGQLEEMVKAGFI